MMLLLAGLAFADAPKFEGEIRTLELDQPGGIGGAPDGMVFIVPPGTQAETFAGDLGDGTTGLRIVAKAPGDAVACTASVPMSQSVFVKARVRVAELKPGPADWQGAVVEVRARDEGGALVSSPGLMYPPVATLRAPGDWQEVQSKVPLPAGATRGEVCFRLVVSSGTFEVDRVMVIAPRNGGAAAPSAGAPMAAPAGAPVAVPAAAPMAAPAAAPMATAPAPVRAAVAPGGASMPGGLVLSAPTPTSDVVCSGWLPASRAITVFGELAVTAQDPAAQDWSGLVVEAYARGAGGPLIPAGGAPYTALRARTLPGSDSFSETWRPPRGAQQVKVCVRASAAAGSAAVDWRGDR